MEENTQDKVEKKNFSFFMPVDFIDELSKVTDNDPIMKAMSRSQAVYYIVSKVAKLGIDLDSGEGEETDQ